MTDEFEQIDPEKPASLEETNMFRKAMSPNPAQNLKRFVYTNPENLRKQIMSIYPESTHIIIVDNDKRDGLGTPTITTKQMRAQIHEQWQWSGNRRVNRVNWEQPEIIFCLVEAGQVAVKKVTRESPQY